MQSPRIFSNQEARASVPAERAGELSSPADQDPLTRIPTRRAFVERPDAEVGRATRYGRELALVLCDLDGFKAVNDTLGHAAGDEALKRFATAAASSLRRADDVFRIGGDEFALLLAEATEEDAREVIDRVRARLGEMRVSFGVASCPSDATDASSLFRLADSALYEAKRSGSGVHFVA